MASLRYAVKVCAILVLFAIPCAMVAFAVVRMHMLSSEVVGLGGWFRGFRP